MEATIYILLIIINLLSGWVYLLKHEETIEYTTHTKYSIRDTHWGGVVIALIFGFILLLSELMKFGTRYFYLKSKE